ncbi:WD40 repeat domain-containing protein [Nocardioides sp.]|uniref:WD40 repeat domain-containing protein n=1 Tax=Nocardioides sp. TaxID=35761 RepID=UPI002717FD9C|nr:WD40 repeat domain-containing protein [Nocardioides sp.]MDO9455640.1 WD40 repeat domain-containing protein [Nocardioides sp.]
MTRLDGSTVDVGPVGRLLVVLPDGRTVMDVLSRRIDVYDVAGTRRASYQRSPKTVVEVTSDRTAVAWIGADRHLRVLGTGAAEPVRLAAPPEVRGFVSISCAVPQADCAATTYDLHSRVVRRVSATGVEPVTSLPRTVTGITDVSPDGTTLAATMRDAEGPFGCLVLYDLRRGAVTERNCRTDSLRFAPDGRHLLRARYAPTNGSQAIDVYDRRLEQVTSLTLPAHLTIEQVAWTDDDSILVELVDAEGYAVGVDYHWRILDLPIDGSTPDLLRERVLDRDYERGPLWVFSHE